MKHNYCIIDVRICRLVSLYENKDREMSEQQQNTARKIGPGGFTLIELLVVISIMSMLMSILLPSLNRAREAGQRVVCSSNMRQLTMEWMMYAMDNDDKLCSADTLWNDPGSNWVADGYMVRDNNIGGTKHAIKDGVMWPYTEHTLDLYLCKTDRSALLRSYSISRTMNGKTCNCEHDNINPFRTYSEISRPGEKMVFIDASSRERWIDGSFCPVADITAQPPKWFYASYRNITARHGDGCNLSFADIHCEYLKWKDPRTVKLANWQINPDDASDGNPDLQRMVNLLKGRY